MAGLTSINVVQELNEKFSHRAAQTLMDYLKTYNCESQVVAAEGTVGIQSTATKAVMLNGQPLKLTVDAQMLIASSTDERSLTAWAVTTAYTVGNIRENSAGLRFRCIEAHTSRDGSDSDFINNEPGKSDNWAKYWEQADHDATNARGTSITASYDQWFLITAIADGTLQIWEAGDEAATGYAEVKIPMFDAKLYIPIGMVHIANGSASEFVVGTTSWATGSVVETYLQLTGPIFPHVDNWDRN